MTYMIWIYIYIIALLRLYIFILHITLMHCAGEANRHWSWIPIFTMTMTEHRVFKKSRNIPWELRVRFGGAVVRHCVFLELLVQNEGCVGSRWDHNTVTMWASLGWWVLEHVQPFRTLAHNTHTQSLRYIYFKMTCFLQDSWPKRSYSD